MKIAVAGGTGQAGSQAVQSRQARAGTRSSCSPDRRASTSSRATGAAAALEGVDAVIDASGVSDDADPVGFHTDVARTLHTAEKSAGVRHHVVLSIVGADRAAEYPLYAAKVAQERAAEASGIPFTIVRSTQFHEFAAQLWRFGKRGSGALRAARTLAARRGARGGRTARRGGDRETRRADDRVRRSARGVAVGHGQGVGERERRRPVGHTPESSRRDRARHARRLAPARNGCRARRADLRGVDRGPRENPLSSRRAGRGIRSATSPRGCSGRRPTGARARGRRSRRLRRRDSSKPKTSAFST